MNPHDTLKLAGCDPDLIRRLDRVLARMEASGHLMMVTDGLRTTAQQQSLYAQGRTVPGRIVTHADGVRTRSNHQSGHAADCCFIVAGKPSWDAALPWKQYGEALEAEGLSWGGRWPEPKTDDPHAELSQPQTVRTGMTLATGVSLNH